MLFEEAYRLPDFEANLSLFNSLRVILATKTSAWETYMVSRVQRQSGFAEASGGHAESPARCWNHFFRPPV